MPMRARGPTAIARRDAEVRDPRTFAINRRQKDGREQGSTPDASIEIAEVNLSKCDWIRQSRGSLAEPSHFTRGEALDIDHPEQTAPSKPSDTNVLSWRKLGGNDRGAPAQGTQLELSHGDTILTSGFLAHIKRLSYAGLRRMLERSAA
ncbi:MAG: carbon-phosphorus lyase complex subunit PhnI [Pseudomonadota bacterium]